VAGLVSSGADAPFRPVRLEAAPLAELPSGSATTAASGAERASDQIDTLREGTQGARRATSGSKAAEASEIDSPTARHHHPHIRRPGALAVRGVEQAREGISLKWVRAGRHGPLTAVCEVDFRVGGRFRFDP